MAPEYICPAAPMIGVANLANVPMVLNKLLVAAAVCPYTVVGIAREVVESAAVEAVVVPAAAVLANKEEPPEAYATAAMAAILTRSFVGAHMVRFVSSLQVKFLQHPRDRMKTVEILRYLAISRCPDACSIPAPRVVCAGAAA